MRVPEWSGESRPSSVRAGELYKGVAGGEPEDRCGVQPPRQNRERSTELERTLQLLAADLDSCPPMPSRVERWRRILFFGYGARANAADALAAVARVRGETTEVLHRSTSTRPRPVGSTPHPPASLF